MSDLRTLCIGLTLFTVALITAPAAAQSTGTVRGQVVNADDAPLPGVNVVLEDAQAGTTTDSTGRFRLTNVPVGPDTLAAQFVGYAPARRAVRVSAGHTARVSITLRPTVTQMRGITVTSLRPSAEPTGTLHPDQIRSAEVADPGALLRTLPGVDAVRRGPLGLDPNVRGLTETQVGVYIGGLRTFPAGPGRMDSPMSHVDPSTIKSINVVKGPYALTWGPGNMSAIRVEQRGEDPPPTPLTGAVHTGYDSNRNATETTAFAMGRQGDWFYSANGAWRRGSDYTAGNGASVAGDFASAEGRGRLGVRLSDASTLALTGSYQDQNDLDYPGRMLHAEYFETGMGQLTYTFDRDRGVIRSVDARIGAQQTLHRMTNKGKPSYDMGMRIRVPTQIQNYNGRVAMDLALGSDWHLTVGGDVLHTFREATRTRSMVGMARVNREKAWPGVTMTQEGVFAKANRTVGRVTLTATTRLDLSQADVNAPTALFRQTLAPGTALAQNDVMLNGALTASMPLSEAWTLSLGAGSVARPPDAMERYADRFPASKSQMSAEFQGTPSLSPERSTQGDLWLERRGAQWSLSINGFARWVDDYITFEETSISPVLPMSPAVYRYRNGEATFLGSEVSASVTPIESVTLRASGSYLWGRDESLDEPAFGVAPPSADLGLRWRPPVALPRASNLFVDGTVRLVDAQNRVATARGETTTDGYTTVGLTAGARLLEQVDLEVGVENLFDVTYTNHLNAKNPFSGAQVLEPGRVVTTNLTVRF